ncbi:MAG: YIP1 family protein [Defluviitaleaceae bacterium]|nr:YIP1 family protein [Defluviitaleaceae bacterium]
MASLRSFDFREYLKSLLYVFYIFRKPLAGFWDLIHEGKGSMAAAHTFVLLMIVVQVLRQTVSNFQFVNINMESFNIVMVFMQIIIPMFLWCVANWSLTTLLDGKGKLSHIYMGAAYALAPMIIIDAALIPVSHVLTYDEAMLYDMFTQIGIGWFVLLLLCAMKEIHDYSFAKAIGSSLLTVLAIGIILFIFIMFFAVISDGIAYVISLIQEISMRL